MRVWIWECDMTHSDVWQDPFRYVTWPVQMCNMTHSDVWHDPFRCVTWPIQMCDTTHSHVWHDSPISEVISKSDPEASSSQAVIIGLFCRILPLLKGSFAVHIIRGCEWEAVRQIERWGAGVETQKNVRGEIEGWGRVPFNEPYAPSLSTIYDGA